MTTDLPLQRIQGYHSFHEGIDHLSLPEKFNFPFYYTPHQLSKLAAKQLQEYINGQAEWDHNFGIDDAGSKDAIGKMFGVLIVKNTRDEIGFLAAFSGKLAGSNAHSYFVPPVFDMLQDDSYFRREEEILNALNSNIEKLENAENYVELKTKIEETELLAKNEIKSAKNELKDKKRKRKSLRKEALEVMSDADFEQLKAEHIEESLRINYQVRDLVKNWNNVLTILNAELLVFQDEIDFLKQERKSRSNGLQKWLFSQYKFLNANSKTKDLIEIFNDLNIAAPPAGAGECAAPKLLHQAYKHNLRPICMAEFWWGPVSYNEIRKPGDFYPSCRSKCEPILQHMLKGLDVDENPMLNGPEEGKKIEIVFEDEFLMIINKPHELLSVPGKIIKDSVYERIKNIRQEATGPLIVHRLDMSTSGLMVIAKSKEVHKSIQNQFIRKKVRKRYVAILEKELTVDQGIIELPLRVDLDNRPHQMVCQQYGKQSRTEWKLVQEEGSKTRIHFYPISGRTHQLRVHASHPLGLNNPIVGDDLYGSKGERLYLHAERISFWHPENKKEVTFEVPAEF